MIDLGDFTSNWTLQIVQMVVLGRLVKAGVTVLMYHVTKKPGFVQHQTVNQVTQGSNAH